MDYENLTPQYRIEEYLEAIVEGWAEATQYPYPDYPSWRIEEFLDAFITYIWEDGDHPRHPCPNPVWHIEECLRAIYDVMTGAATPWAFPTPPTNRIEEYLAAIHAYLADGTELPVPEPVWRIEQWLAYVLDGVKQGGDVTKTVSGSPAHITDALAKAALSVLASIEPIQDLHGYANPWPAGGGKNLYDASTFSTVTKNDVTCTNNGDGSFTLNGTASGDAYFDIFVPQYKESSGGTPLPQGSYRITGCPAGGGSQTYYMYITPSYTGDYGNGGTNINTTVTGGSIFVKSGYTCDNLVFRPMIRISTNGDDTWQPYSNICPISGLTGLSVYRRGPNLLNAATNITGSYIGSNGSITEGSDAQYTDLIPVKAGETYLCSFVSGRGKGTNRWHGYNANGSWVKQLAEVSATNKKGSKITMTTTIDSGISYVRLSYGITDTEAMIQWASLSGEIIADRIYAGKMVSGTAIAYRNTPIESPYTSTRGNSGPAMVFGVSPGKMYIAKDDIVTNYTSIWCCCYASIEDIGDASKAISRANDNHFIVPNGANYAVVLYNNSDSGTTFTFGEPYVIEYQRIADYQPYTYDEYPCDWTTQAGTVYGGTLDVVTGVLTVDRAMVDMGERNYTKGNRNTDNTGYVFYFRDTSFKNLGELISSQFKEVHNIPNWEALPVNCCNSAGGSYIVFCADYPDAATFKTAMSGVQLVYELATPLTYQLTPQEVQMLLGENYVWSSSGDTVSVTYYAEGNANPLQSLNILLGGNYSNPKTADDVSDKEALEIILGGNK